MSDFDFLARLDEWLVSDEDFATAYEQTGAVCRSWLKKSISRIFALTKGTPPPATQTQKTWPDGFTARASSRVCDWVCVCLGADFVSPVQLCAALVPALVAGVQELVVLREQNGTPFPSSLLTACELSGAETVCQLPFARLTELLQARHAAGGSGRIVALGQGDFSDLRFSSQDTVFWQTPPLLRMGVVFSDSSRWETALLDWAHPGQPFLRWGAVPADCPLETLPATFPPEDFCGDAFFAPAHLLSGQSALGLAPGHELSWYWPELTVSFFLDTRIAFLPVSSPETTG